MGILTFLGYPLYVPVSSLLPPRGFLCVGQPPPSPVAFLIRGLKRVNPLPPPRQTRSLVVVYLVH